MPDSAPPLGSQRLNVLFVCSRNQWRSPTAVQVWHRDPRVNVRSAGTSGSARHPVSADDLRWADIILVMEQKHKTRLFTEYPEDVRDKRLHVLEIPNDYRYMDPELIELLEHSVAPILGLE